MIEFDRTTPVMAAIRATRGFVDVTAAADATVTVDVVPLDDSDAAHRAAEDTTVTLDGDMLAVTVPESSGWTWRRLPRLGITVRVPAESALSVKTVSADVRSVGRYAQVKVDVASGKVYVEDVIGDADLRAASGTLTANQVGGSLRIRTGSGDVRVGDVTGDVNAGTASGSVAIRSLGGSAKASTASGNVTIEAVRQGTVRASTASGNVRVGVVPGTRVWLDAGTASGMTRNNLAAGDEHNGAGAADAELRLRTASGNITVERAPSAQHTAA
ncbi:DUF4097 family beta strand repeat-containing protein [Mangrovihabitans endophyticus]|uniref:DUF4097 domain-containing protein n=1 Tax=Mangrovihabitans endophyticus TaxID=1751298 RepID=A0A8J3C234_9ACTN|nr:DUF4097 family beta strand repeat-containing protein [Mangrovihabitans endophyticus]GGL03936.1 hypothetical protein GCM10012284_43170 [Mangrovihabitans endophyticus]